MPCANLPWVVGGYLWRHHRQYGAGRRQRLTLTHAGKFSTSRFMRTPALLALAIVALSGCAAKPQRDVPQISTTFYEPNPKPEYHIGEGEPPKEYFEELDRLHGR